VLTTDAPLELDAPVDHGIEGVCDRCQACVRRCPVGAIPAVRKEHRGVTKAKLNTKRCLPIVTQATDKVSLAEKYNEVAGKAARLGLMKKEDANVQQYVTEKALDGLYAMIGEQERQIRQDPVGTGSAILRKVFGQ